MNFVRHHREGVLYCAALVGYVLFGAFVNKLVFNWIAGPVWALLFIYWVPMRMRRRRQIGGRPVVSE